MAISFRLRTIADLVTAGYSAADIGTDHGYVPIYLVRSGICPKIIASDVSKGSLMKAKENIQKYALCSRIECRLSDGLKEFAPGEVQACIISGMGGILMSDILKASPLVTASFKELILSPHRDADLVRQTVREFGFEIVFDGIVADKKKKYIVLKAAKVD